ncbi:MAG: hypothetical protein RQ722_09460, partial [Desulfuromonadales bacterium]|nr:hypothetical protein [Desulfuromonadales bacterium]
TWFTEFFNYNMLLLPQFLLGLTDLPLHFSGYFLDFTRDNQLGIVGKFPGQFFDLAFHLVQLSFGFVSGA